MNCQCEYSYTAVTDVVLCTFTQWAYGITCWEVFSLGRAPYPTIPNREILQYIDDGNRLPKPDLCPETM